MRSCLTTNEDFTFTLSKSSAMDTKNNTAIPRIDDASDFQRQGEELRHLQHVRRATALTSRFQADRRYQEPVRHRSAVKDRLDNNTGAGSGWNRASPIPAARSFTIGVEVKF
ncbi:MAG: hypothetical protein IPG54_09370 [Sphingomonadales bacterium]|nr:hypothetical protein [Sphingomonadales bacterium]